MREHFGIVKNIVEDVDLGTLLIVNLIPSGLPDRWHINYFEHCHRLPRIGDKVSIAMVNLNWKGSFYSKPEKSLDWQEVGF